MIWFSWKSLEDFNLWHNNVMKELKIPKHGVNQKTNKIDELSEPTTKYTDLIKVDKNDFRAFVEEEIANQFKNNLGEPSESPPTPKINL